MVPRQFVKLSVPDQSAKKAHNSNRSEYFDKILQTHWYWQNLTQRIAYWHFIASFQVEKNELVFDVQIFYVLLNFEPGVVPAAENYFELFKNSFFTDVPALIGDLKTFFSFQIEQDPQICLIGSVLYCSIFVLISDFLSVMPMLRYFLLLN